MNRGPFKGASFGALGMRGWPQGWRRLGVVGALAIAGLLMMLPAAIGWEAHGEFGSRQLVVHTDAGTTIAMSVGSSTNVFSFIPNAFPTSGATLIAPGTSVTIDITNLGTLAHTFTLSSLVNYTLSTTSGNLTGTFLVTHPAYYSINISATQGSVTIASFVAPTVVGSYQFFCTETGHFAEGMEGFMGVGITVGPPPPPPGIGTPVFIIAGVIVGLVILAIVLGFVVGKREGSKHEMPPERLGYPETPLENPPSKPPQ